MQYKKMLTTMVTTGSPNPVQKNSPSAHARSILMMHQPFTLSWQGTPTLLSPRNYFFEKKTPVFTQICGVHESPNSDAPSKKIKAIFDPANSGLSLLYHH
jgi:hypothetical protein